MDFKGAGQKNNPPEDDAPPTTNAPLPLPEPDTGNPPPPLPVPEPVGSPILPDVPDVTYGVMPEVDNNIDLPSTLASVTYNVRPVMEDANAPSISDVTYGVKPEVEEANAPVLPDIFYDVKALVEDIKTPSMADVFFGVKPVVEDFNPPDITAPEEYHAKEPSASGDASSTEGGNTGSAPVFAPVINITVEGGATEQSIENLRETMYDMMRELYEEFRNQELEHQALKEQLAF